MSIIPTADATFGFIGPEGRRSTRIERPVPLLITGHDGLGQEFLERTSAVSLNLHGCRYPSRHDCHVGSWITLQIGEAPLGEIVTTTRAQVRSVQIPRPVKADQAAANYKDGILTITLPKTEGPQPKVINVQPVDS